MNQMLDAALRYADLRWKVMPQWWPVFGFADTPYRFGCHCACPNPDCSNVGKHPLGLLVPHGRADASADPATLSRWWRAYPAANIAVATGPESGVWVLDLDGEEGRNSMLELVAQHGKLPPTVRAVSGSGGLHFFFRWPADRAPRSTGVRGWPGVDVRGRGSSATLAPSLHRSGRRYEWKPGHAPWEREPADAPAWLLDLVDPPRPAPKPVPAVVVFGDREERRARGILRSVLSDLGAALPGNRNHALNAAAFSLGGLVGSGYLDRFDVANQLEAVALSIGLGEHEARGTIRSGLDDGAASPRYLEAG